MIVVEEESQFLCTFTSKLNDPLTRVVFSSQIIAHLVAATRRNRECSLVWSLMLVYHIFLTTEIVNRKMRLGTPIPNFTADTTKGKIKFHEWAGTSWVMLFSHPADFTPVCTTELGRIAEKASEFNARGVLLLGHSCDSVARHNAWIKDIQSQYGGIPVDFPYPVIGDETRIIAERLDMTDMRDPDTRGVRALYLIGPDKTLRLSMLYPDSTGRNVDEVLRVIDSLHRADERAVVTPVDWRMGEDLLLQPDVPAIDEARLFPRGIRRVNLPSGLAYVRYTADYPLPHECWE